MEQLYILAGFNACICAAIFMICVARLGKMSTAVRVGVRLKYVSLEAGAIASAIAPLWHAEYPGYGVLIFASTVLVSIIAESPRWKFGAPADVKKVTHGGIAAH